MKTVILSLLAVLLCLPMQVSAKSPTKSPGKPTAKCLEGDGNDGEGIMAFPDGSRYAGEFRNRQFEGEGVMTYPDGARHEGQWKEGKRHGIVFQ